VRRHFRPELLNRLDEIVIFDPLSHEQLRKVARLQMKDVALRLADKGVALAVSDAALDIVLSESYDPVSISLQFSCPISQIVAKLRLKLIECMLLLLQVYGARPIRRWLEKRVVTQLSKMLIREEIDENSTVYIDALPGKKELSYRVEKNGGLVNLASGKKSDILIEIPNGTRSDAAQAVKKMKIEAEEMDEEEMDEE